MASLGSEAGRDDPAEGAPLVWLAASLPTLTIHLYIYQYSYSLRETRCTVLLTRARRAAGPRAARQPFLVFFVIYSLIYIRLIYQAYILYQAYIYYFRWKALAEGARQAKGIGDR